MSENNDAINFWLKLVGAPPPHILEHRDSIMAKGDRIIEHIFGLELDKEVCVKARELREYFHFQYNPQKGETAKGELERWLNFIRVTSNIFSHYDFHRDEYYFKKLKSNE